MGDAEAIHEFVKQIFTILFGDFSWILVVALVAYGFKNIVTEIVEGVIFYYNGSLKVNDIIYIDGHKKARITRKGFLKTTLYLYNKQDRPYRMVVIPNTRLKFFTIEKPLYENIGDFTDEDP